MNNVLGMLMGFARELSKSALFFGGHEEKSFGYIIQNIVLSNFTRAIYMV